MVHRNGVPFFRTNLKELGLNLLNKSIHHRINKNVEELSECGF